jgi:RimJ/RimL family protein N-acetyltransferase
VENPDSTVSCLLLVIERHTGEVIGSTRFYDWNPDDRSVAVGYSFLIRQHWGGATNTELKRLMLDHAFQKARTVWFHIGADNWRSRRAIEKIGARFSHEITREVQGGAQRVTHYRIDAPMDPSREARQTMLSATARLGPPIYRSSS